MSFKEAPQRWDDLLRLIQGNKGLRKVDLGIFQWPIPVAIWTALASCTTVNISNVLMDQTCARAFWASCQNVEDLGISNLQLTDATDFYGVAVQLGVVHLRLNLFSCDVVGEKAFTTSQGKWLEKYSNLEMVSIDVQLKHRRSYRKARHRSGTEIFPTTGKVYVFEL